MPTRPPHVLVIVQNLPVPLDRRVWLECQALRAQGYRVSVICPKGPGDPARQTIDGVAIYKYRPAPEAKGLAGFAWEFGYSWVRTAVLSLAVLRRGRIDVVQACNPPDTYWLLGLLHKLGGARFVFDQHDLNPELFLSRFGVPTGRAATLQLGLLRWLERMTYRVADRVVSTNESYRAIALRRGRKDPAAVTVVRSGPDTTAMRPVHLPDRPADPRKVLAYLGIMGPQDGVDLVLTVMDELVHRRGRTDVRAVLMGFGDCYEDLVRQCAELRLDDWVTFTGRAGRDVIAEQLSGADIGLCPDLKTPLNDVSTMNKTMEYMAYALPSVAFDLVETRVSGADSVLYVPSGDVAGFTDAVQRLLDDPGLRVRLGRQARERVSAVLDWKPQSQAYVSVFDELLGRPSAAPAAAGPVRTHDPAGHRYVDLADDAAFDAFIEHRGRAVSS